MSNLILRGVKGLVPLRKTRALHCSQVLIINQPRVLLLRTHTSHGKNSEGEGFDTAKFDTVYLDALVRLHLD